MIQGTKISEIAEKTSLNGKEYIPIQDGNANKKVKTDKLVQKSQLATINGQRIDEPKNIVVGGGSGGSVIVDSALSSTSVNPVQNKVVTEKLAQLEDKTKNTVHSSEREEKIELLSDSGKKDYNGEIFPCVEGTNIWLKSLMFDTKKVIEYFSDTEGKNLIDSVTQDRSGYWEHSLQAPKGTKAARISGQYDNTRPFIAKITHPMAEMTEAFKAIGTMEKKIEDSTKNNEAIPSTERIETIELLSDSNTKKYIGEILPCVEGTSIWLKSLVINTMKVIEYFSDTEGKNLIDSVTQDRSGYWEHSLQAPKGTKAARISGQYDNTRPFIAKITHPMAEMTEAFKAISQIGKNGGGGDTSKPETACIPSSEREEKIELSTEGGRKDYKGEIFPCCERTSIQIKTLCAQRITVIEYFGNSNGTNSLAHVDLETGGYKEYSLVAPKGTKSARICGQYDKGRPFIAKITHPMTEMMEAFKNVAKIEKRIGIGGNDLNIIGDSISQGIAAGFERLQPVNPQLGIVWSNGVGGEGTLATLERQGSLPLMVYPFTLKRGNLSVDVCAISQKLAKDTYDKDTGLVVYPPLWSKYKNKTGYTEDNGNVFVPFSVNNLGGRLKGELNGVLCTVMYDTKRGMSINVDKPLEEDWRVTSPSEFKPLDSEKYRGMITICEMGTNGGFNMYDGNNEIIGLAGTIPWNQAYLNPSINGENTEENKRIANRIADNLVSEYKTARNYCYHPDKFIAVGFYSRSFANSYFYPIYEAKMTAEFGANFFNAREYLIRDGWRDCGYPLSAGDIEDINKGIVPRCFFGESTGGAHISMRGNTAIAYKILMRCYELNIIDFVPKIVDLNTIVDFRYRISGTIKNTDGAPLKGATVSLYIDILDPVVKATDANGFFRFQELVTENSTMHIKVEMSGYQTYESPVVTFADKEYNVTLQRL